MGPRNEYTKSSTTSQQKRQPLYMHTQTTSHAGNCGLLHHILEMVDNYITYWNWWTRSVWAMDLVS